MSENIRTRLRKRRQSEHNNESGQKQKRAIKKSKTSGFREIHKSISNVSTQNVNISSSSSNSSSYPEMCENENPEVLIHSTDSEDTKEYESESSHDGETPRQNLKPKTDFSGVFGSKSGNCELLTKLLNDTNDHNCQATCNKSEGTKRSYECPKVESDQVYFDSNHASDQLPASSHRKTNRKDVSRCCDQPDLPLHNKRIASSDASLPKGYRRLRGLREEPESGTVLGTTLRSMQQPMRRISWGASLCLPLPVDNNAIDNKNNSSDRTPNLQHEDSKDHADNMKHQGRGNWSIICEDKQDNSARMKAGKRDNPHLIELITKDEATCEANGELKQGHDILEQDELDISEFKMKEVKGKRKNNTIKSVSSQKRASNNNKDVDVEDKAVIRDNQEDLYTKKTSIRLRRRSGDTWAVRYEKDFVLTPLAKLSKDDATFLPPKGIDATMVSEENLCRQLKHRYDRSAVVDQFDDATTASTSSEKRKKGVHYRRKKYKRKYASKHATNRKYALKKKHLCTTPLGLEQQGMMPDSGIMFFELANVVSHLPSVRDRT